MTPPEYVHSPPAMKRRRLSVDGDRDCERARQIPRLHGSPPRITQQFPQQQQQPRPHLYQQPQQSQTQPQQRASGSGPSPMVPPTSENWPSRGSSPYATNGSLPAMRSPMEPEAERKQHVINAPELRPTLPSLPLLNLDRSASAVVAAAPPPPPPPPPRPPPPYHHHHHHHQHPSPAASSARTVAPRYRSQDDYAPEEVPPTATAARIPTRPPLRTIEPPQVPSQFPPTGPAAASTLHHHHASRVDPPLLPYGPMHPFEPAHFSASSSAASGAVSGPGVPAAPTAPTLAPASVAAAAAPQYPECLGGLTMGLGYGGAAMVLGSAAALGISLDATRQRKRRGNLPKETTDKLRSWFIAHLSHPYPTEDEKQELMRQTGLQMSGFFFFFVLSCLGRFLDRVIVMLRIIIMLSLLSSS